MAGANIAIAGGKATGAAAGGDILLQTSNAGASGTTLQSLTTKMIVKANGNVGIGTTTPQSLLHVVGGIQLGDDTATCPGASNVKLGTLRFNSDDLQVCKSGGWSAIGSGGGSGNTVTGSYTGNGAASQSVNLGFRPKMVIVKGINGTYKATGITIDGIPDAAAHSRIYASNGVAADSIQPKITATGFDAFGNANDSSFNYSGTVYHYVAIKDGGGSGGTATAAGDGGQVQFNDGFDAFATDAALHWDNTNKRLGIGTATPTNPLTVSATDNATLAGIKNKTTGTDSIAILSMENDARNWQLRVDGTDVDKLKIYDGAASAYRLSIDASGNVGIGTTSPTARLDVRGQSVFQNNISNILLVQNATDNDTYAGGTMMTIQNSGQSALNKYLSFVADYDADEGGAVNFGALTLLAGNSFGISNPSGGALALQSTDGNVGIGTTTPSQKLEVAANTWATIASTVADATGTTYPAIIGQRSRGTLASKSAVASNDVAFALQGKGWDGSAYASAAAIHAAVDGTPGANDMPGRLVFSTTPDGSATLTERMRITSSGNVGIGTTAPQSLLQVAGGIQLGDDTATCPGASNVKLGTLRFNSGALQVCVASGWTGLNGSGGGSNTMYPNFPDAIRCTEGAETRTFLLTIVDATRAIYRDSTAGANDMIQFNPATGAYATQSGYGSSDCVTGTKSIATLYAEGKAFNFVGGATASAAGTSGQVQFNEGGNLKADAALHWDNTNKRFGIGTTSPTEQFHIYNATGAFMRLSAPTAGHKSIYLADSDNSGKIYELSHRAGSDDFGLLFYDGASWYHRLYVNAVGNVGIGTTSPSAKLHLRPSVASTQEGIFIEDPTAPTYGARFVFDDANSKVIVGSRNNGTDIDALVIDRDTGNVGIGTSTTGTTLSVVGSQNYTGTAPSVSSYTATIGSAGIGLVGIGSHNSMPALQGMGTGTAYALYLNPAAGSVIIATGGGNVGVGTTAPSYKLHVAGQVAGNAAYVNTSDARLKTDVQDLDYGLDTVMRLRPVSFQWKTQAEDWQKGRKLGLIAQEAEKVAPEIVSTATDADHTKSIAYGDVTPILIKAVQELKAANDNLKHETDDIRNELRATIDIQDREIEVLRREIEVLKADTDAMRSAPGDDEQDSAINELRRAICSPRVANDIDSRRRHDIKMLKTPR